MGGELYDYMTITSNETQLGQNRQLERADRAAAYFGK